MSPHVDLKSDREAEITDLNEQSCHLSFVLSNGSTGAAAETGRLQKAKISQQKGTQEVVWCVCACVCSWIIICAGPYKIMSEHLHGGTVCPRVDKEG